MRPLNFIQWVTIATALAVAVMLPFILIKISNEQHHQNDALRSIICRAEHVVKTEPGIPAEQRRRAFRFYEQALRGAHLAPCDRS